MLQHAIPVVVVVHRGVHLMLHPCMRMLLLSTCCRSSVHVQSASVCSATSPAYLLHVGSDILMTCTVGQICKMSCITMASRCCSCTCRGTVNIVVVDIIGCDLHSQAGPVQQKGTTRKGTARGPCCSANSCILIN